MAGAAPNPEPPPDDKAATDVEQLFDRYADRLHRYVYHYVKSWETAQDLVQDLFLRLWDRRSELASVNDVESYLYTAARNRALAHLRHQRYEDDFRARPAGPTLLDPTTPRAADPAAQLDSAEIAAAVQRAVDALPARQRQALLLQWSGNSYAQIATALDISPKTVAIHLGRAIRQLRRTLAGLRATLAHWLERAPGFNLDRVQAPVLVQAIGPESVLFEWEVYAGLMARGKPVDMLYLPEGSHILVKPLERIASQQASVDWFRFWLKGEDDPDPSKVGQYARWRELRR